MESKIIKREFTYPTIESLMRALEDLPSNIIVKCYDRALDLPLQLKGFGLEIYERTFFSPNVYYTPRRNKRVFLYTQQREDPDLYPVTCGLLLSYLENLEDIECEIMLTDIDLEYKTYIGRIEMSVVEYDNPFKNSNYSVIELVIYSKED